MSENKPKKQAKRGRPRKVINIDKVDMPVDGHTHIQDEQIIDALMTYRGIVSNVAKSLKVSRAAIYKRISSNEKIKQAQIDGREIIRDDVEDAFLEAVRNKETWAIKIGVERLLGPRGYVANQSISVTNENPQVVLNMDIEKSSTDALKKAEAILRKDIQKGAKDE
jgi:hypothetical protein